VPARNFRCKEKCNHPRLPSVINYERSANRAAKETNNPEKTMKRNSLALTALIVLALGGFAVALAENAGGHGRWHGHAFGLEHMTKALDLTPEQQAKVRPIVDQTRPQIIAIHEEAMQKTKALMDNAMSQIRPLLTAEQQKKLDDLKKAHEDMRNARQRLHEAMKE
jgi:Spy/CpxP family protein refolding chaperone